MPRSFFSYWGVLFCTHSVPFVFVLSILQPTFLTSFLFYQDRKEEGAAILKKLYPPHEVEAEVEALRLSVEAEIVDEGSIGAGNILNKIKNSWSNTVVRRGLAAGIGCQVIQQILGINTVIYYSPTIVQLAGYDLNSVALALSLITSGLNAFGSIVNMLFVDRYGRRKLLLVSMVGIIICLFMLTSVFEYAKIHAPAISGVNTAAFENSNCVHYTNAASWDCMSCLVATDDCGFCANSGDHLKPGACLAFGLKKTCQTGAREWYSRGCPSNVKLLAVLLLGLYILAYSPDMGTVSWIVNLEIYPLRHRGICRGIAAIANWSSNLIVSQTFLSLIGALGSGYTFMLFGFISSGALVYLYMFVSETKGLTFEEVKKKLTRTWKAWENHSDDEDSTSGKAVP
ncbi:hypothetical protein GIB67_016151 [Kingdonia uniflora]|uniref:Major facilitator superfamily (MFS) profile domain-containing protein n=1 Tax=Kingdonia uniflora TaxID=39325 RepID=A0A7J7N995_9MAGN|nr:hypothetical protein GIB67_016151 [Kingdonia uniflora]